jgi:CRP-like cAMP-binding protein
MDILSGELREIVKVDLYKNLLLGCKILSDNLSEQFLEVLCSRVRSSKCSPGEVLFRTGEESDKLFIVMEGEI